jgi:hypothetical protein
VNAIKNGWEQTDDDSCSGAPTSVMDECHTEKVESVLQRTHSISCTAIVTEVRTSLGCVNRILNNISIKQKVCAHWIPHFLNNDQLAMHVFHATAHLQRWKNEGIAILDCILIVEESWMHLFDPQLKRKNAE